MKITKSQLENIIREELAIVKESGTFGDRTYDHSLVSDVSKTIQWDISQAFNFVLDLLEDVNAHTEYKAVQKVLWDSLEDANPVQEDASLPSGGDPAKQEYDALTTMISRLDGMEAFLLNTTRQKSDEALTQQAAEQLSALRATLSQMRKGL